MAKERTHNPPDYDQHGSSYQDPGPHGFTSPPQAPSGADLPQSSALTNDGSVYQSFNDVQKGNVAGEDIFLFGPCVKVEYDEVFKEPTSYGRYFSVAALNRLIFSGTQIAVYLFFSVLFGILLSFLWGIFFAILNFFTVYLMQPTVKSTFVLLRTIASIARAIIRSVLDPFYESFGLMFSRIKGNFSLNASGFLPTVAKTERATIQEI